MSPNQADGRITKSSAIWIGSAAVVVLGAIQATWNMASGLYSIRDQLSKDMQSAQTKTAEAFGDIKSGLVRLEVRVDNLERTIISARGQDGR